MSEIIEEISKLPVPQRREIARRIFDMENDAALLDYYSHLADEQFLEMDRMEAADAEKRTG